MDIDDDIRILWEDDTPFCDLPDYLLQSNDNLGSVPRNCVSSGDENCVGKIDDYDYAVAVSVAMNDGELKENTNANMKDKNCVDDYDYAVAVSVAMNDYDDGPKENTNANTKKSETSKPLSIIDAQWELIDPHPDIHALFIEFDEKFFYGKLKSVEIRWSHRMTLCAGICSYQGRGGLCSIALSVPLLKLRPRRDLIETLLHEMIHAYLFVTDNNKDRDGHGPEFLSHMHRINKETGANITVFHTFHAEVDLYKEHWWKCDGPCRNRPPFFGLVKRVMNRAPGPNDKWWAVHQASCGGKFVKIKEPSNFSEKKSHKHKKRLHSDSKSKPDIRTFLKVSNPGPSNKESSNPRVLNIESPTLSTPKSALPKGDTLVATNSTETASFCPFTGTGQKLGSSSVISQVPSSFSSLNLKDLHLERKRNWPFIISEKTVTKKDGLGISVDTGNKISMSSSSLEKSLTKKNLNCNSTGKASTKRNVSSSSSGNGLISTPHCPPGALLKCLKGDSFKLASPTFNIPEQLEKQTKSASASSTNMKELDQKAKPEKVLPSRNVSDNIDNLQKNSVIGVSIPSINSVQLYCPVCSCLIEEEINSHLDKCLKM